MNTLNATKLTTLKLSALAIALGFSSAVFSAIENDTFTNNDWQSSLAQEFSQLDASGNGLILPNEASKGMAFNKKTFATADTDHDGTIDQAEYIQYKTGTGEKNVSASNTSNDNSSKMTTDLPSTANAMTDEPVIKEDTAEMSQVSTEPKKRSVGVVVDDSVITTKAKAAIFNTPDLKTLDISVQTRQGEVVLTGDVVSEAAKMKAEEVVRNVGGVTAVTNKLQVKN